MTGERLEFTVKFAVAGTVQGEALVSRVPLSFWGGLDPKSGMVTDRRHDLHGSCITGKVLFIPEGRGSSSSSSVLLEAIRLGTAPKAIINVVTEPIVATGSIIGRVLYGRWVPIVALDQGNYSQVRTGDIVHLVQTSDNLGTLVIERSKG